MKPCSSDSLSCREASDIIAERLNDSDHLMSRDDGRQPRVQLSLNNVKIGAAYAARFDSQ
jgi:hypothetical protein